MALANLVFHPSTWSPTVYCYLEDMFVAPTARGPSVALDLIRAVFAEAALEDATSTYWHTQEFNGPARSLSDQVAHLARGFPISLNSTSKHIRVLEDAGLVRRSVRGREHILTLDGAPLAEAAGWIARYQAFWSEQLASLDAFVTLRGKAGRSS